MGKLKCEVLHRQIHKCKRTKMHLDDFSQFLRWEKKATQIPQHLYYSALPNKLKCIHMILSVSHIGTMAKKTTQMPQHQFYSTILTNLQKNKCTTYTNKSSFYHCPQPLSDSCCPVFDSVASVRMFWKSSCMRTSAQANKQ